MITLDEAQKFNAKLIPLAGGKFVMVDAEDYLTLSQFKWHYHHDRLKGYAARTTPRNKEGKQDTIKMHRQIMNAPKGTQIDHINGDRLDNRKANLRFCTSLQNVRNTALTARNSSGYKGVSFFPSLKKWRADIRVNKKLIHLGLYVNIKDAAKAYNEAAIIHFKDFAWLNPI